MLLSHRSSVDFKSNIYPVKTDQVVYDSEFLHSLRDAGAIKEFERRTSSVSPTSIQREISRKGIGVTKCAYSPEGDFSWGTVLEDGVERIVCRCEQYDCPIFPECRPGVTPPVVADIGETFAVSNEVEMTKRSELESREVEGGDYVFESGSSCVVTAMESLPALFGSSCRGGFSEAGSRDASALEVVLPVSDVATEEIGSFEIEEKVYGISSPSGSDGLGEECVSPGIVYDEAALEVECISDESSVADDVIDSGQMYLPGKNYDAQQARIVRADPSSRIYVNAGAGTGKTHTLIEKLKYMIGEQGVEPDGITVLSFTRSAVDVVQDRLKAAAASGEIDAPWQDIDVTTIDKLASRILYWCASEEGSSKELKRIARLDYDERIVAATRKIKTEPEILSGCSHIVVDETQDLVTVRADFILAILKNIPDGCGFTILGDRCQAIYEYQVKDKKSTRHSKTSSMAFYKELVRQFAPIEIYLEKNYRQSSSFPLDLMPMRRHILNGEYSESLKDAEQYVKALGRPEKALASVGEERIKEELDAALKRGSVGFLTRYNADSLELESFLWKRGIPCIQDRSDANCKAIRCFADALVGYEGQTIDRQTFESRCCSSDPYKDGRIWGALLSLDGIRADGSRVRVERILSALRSDALPAALEAVRADCHAVSVSTIHKAKGREFDSVCLFVEDMEEIAASENPDEAKVAYVALSRAVSDLGFACLHQEFLEEGKKVPRAQKMFDIDRYFRKTSGRHARRGKKRVINFEIKNERDVDFFSFGESSDIQELLASGYLEGAGLRLLLRGSGLSSHYLIVLEDDEGCVLGKIKHEFCYDYERVSGNAAAPLPDAFDSVFIDRVVSCVGPASSAPQHATTFGSMAIWYGVTIGGFARRDDSQNY